MEPNQPQQKSSGALIGTIIVIIILVIGGIYLWQKNMDEKAVDRNTQGSTTAAQLDAQVQSMDIDHTDDGL
ncbi:MAG: hypothetical protein WDN09_00480 [bacterium]